MLEPLPGSMPLVGRVEELARLHRALQTTVAGRGGALLVAGEAGVGKTRLVAELARTAQAEGGRVLIGRCIDLIGPAVPFYSLLEALRTADRQSPGTSLSAGDPVCTVFATASSAAAARGMVRSRTLELQRRWSAPAP